MAESILPKYFIVEDESGSESIPPGSLWIQEGDAMRRAGLDQRVSRDAAAFTMITKDDFDLLRAVNLDTDRILIFRDREWMQEGRCLKSNDRVVIKNANAIPEGVTGTIRVKGHLTDEVSGILFGIELDQEHKGRGCSDGKFKQKRYFKCDPDCALFYSLKFIRKHSETLVDSFRHLDLRSTVSIGSQMIGERVVWISEHGPEYGVIRWVGDLPELGSDSEKYAGVEFDNPIGKGTGRYKGRSLFRCEDKHASLVPLIGLMLARDYDASRRSERLEAASACTSRRESLATSGPASPTDVERVERSSVDRATVGTVDFRLGDRVAVRQRSGSRAGVIRWLDRSTSGEVIAGLEMDDADPRCYTDGEFQGRVRFRCAPQRAFFVYLHLCQHAPPRSRSGSEN